jgi:hypothetical protein
MAAEKKNSKFDGEDKVSFKKYENVRCRVCRIVDGYGPEEDRCRFCGAKLFKGDIL